MEVSRLADSYSISAKHYDSAYAALKTLVDLPFYLDLAKQSAGPVLEIACGTGRVLLPIAREGIEIHGIDNSAPMLQVLKSHLDREPPEVRRRVTLHSGDMRRFVLNKKFSLIISRFAPCSTCSPSTTNSPHSAPPPRISTKTAASPSTSSIPSSN